MDVGDKRIGVAVSDEMGITAQGLKTLNRENVAEDVADIGEIIKDYAVKRVVVGLPRNMNGTYGEQAEKVKEFAAELKKATAVEVVYQDERLTTVAAERTLLQGNVSRKKRKGVIDKIAAVMILQGYLDSAHL